jgi:NADH:ubiquinone oxidoreductase subunit K
LNKVILFCTLKNNSIPTYCSIVLTNPVFIVSSISDIKLNFIWFGIIFFFIALFSFFFGHNDVIRILMTYEIMFLGNIFLFSCITYYFKYFNGYVTALLLLAVAAVETGIGLALLIRAHRLYKSIRISDYNKLRSK